MEDIIKALLQTIAVQHDANRRAAENNTTLSSWCWPKLKGTGLWPWHRRRVLIRWCNRVSVCTRWDFHEGLWGTTRCHPYSTERFMPYLKGWVQTLQVAIEVQRWSGPASHYLHKMSTTDDVEAYLLAFQHTVERERWPVAYLPLSQVGSRKMPTMTWSQLKLVTILSWRLKSLHT